MSRLNGAAQLALLAASAGLTRPDGNRWSWPARVAKLPENLAQPVVNFLEDGRPFVEIHVRKRGKPPDGRVDTEVTGGSDSRPNPFWIHGVSISSGTW